MGECEQCHDVSVCRYLDTDFVAQASVVH